MKEQKPQYREEKKCLILKDSLNLGSGRITEIVKATWVGLRLESGVLKQLRFRTNEKREK